MFTRGTLTHSIQRAVIAAISFGVPFLGFALPGWADITIGTLVYAVLHYAQSQVGI